jgi:hypothetical protein
VTEHHEAPRSPTADDRPRQADGSLDLLVTQWVFHSLVGTLTAVSRTPSSIVPFGDGDGPPDATILMDRFLGEVALRQLAEWLPERPVTILDLSRHCPRLVAHMVGSGHTVLHAEAHPSIPDIAPTGAEAVGRLLTVDADPRLPEWLADGTVDAVVAEGSSLSSALVAEVTLDELHRVLRPGGGLLLCVDSLVSGLSRLADQGRWAELADVPSADVVLIPEPDGTYSRCFWPEELHDMLTAAGFAVDWIRPRTVLSEDAVARALTLDPDQLDSLVTTELALGVRRQGESVGGRLVASARKV